jgi:hypothetical protein
MNNTALNKRLQALEARMMTVELQPMIIGLYASTVDDIHKIQAKYPYEAGAMVRMIPVYHGEPSEEAAGLVPPEYYLPKVNGERIYT